MAQLMKRGKVWYVRFQQNGKDVWRTTGKTRKADAQDKADAILAKERNTISLSAMFDDILDRITRMEEESERDKIRRDFARKLLQGTSAKMLVADAWDAWQASPGQQKPSTLQGYKAIWKRFYNHELKVTPKRHSKKEVPGWLQEKHGGVKYLHEVTEAMADSYVADLWGSGVAPTTYNAHVKFLKSIFRTLSRRGGLEINPWDHVKVIEKETESRRQLTKKELETVCSRATGEMRHWIAIGIYTGLRLGDVITLRWDEVNLDAGEIIRIPLKVSRKGERKQITIPIHPVLEKMLQELRDEVDPGATYLFPESAKRYRRERSGVTKPLQDFFESCGIQTTVEPENGHRRKRIVRVGFHSLRHSFVSLCAAKRVPQSAIMDLVGHGSPAMTAIYTHADKALKGRAIKKLPGKLFANGKHEEA
jgi:integrase